MFSPFNDPNVTDWFRRLDAAWRRMPAEEQARQREEVQQHLEGLVAAKIAQGQSVEDAWNAALSQFGDPEQLGQKIYREWRQSRTGFCADLTAIAFGIGLYMLLLVSVQMEGYFGIFGSIHASHFSAVGRVLAYAENIVIYVILGRRYPVQAIKGSLYSQCFGFCCLWTYFCTSAPIDLPRSMAVILPSFALGVIIHAVVAYLASVTKRGWYRPTWEDFKLTLPKRRRIAG